MSSTDAAPDVRPTLSPEHPWLLPALLMSEFDNGPAPRAVGRTRREWVLEVGYTVLALLLGCFSFAGHVAARPQVATVLLAADAIGVVVGCVTLWLWRRWPLVTTVISALLIVVAPSIGVTAGINATRAVIHHRFVVGAGVTALLTVSWLLVPILYPIAPLQYGAQALIVVVGGVAVLAWGSFVRARRQLLLSMAERANRVETEQQLRVEQARQLEREHIAREMHDVLAHRLSLLSMHAGALEFRRDADHAEVTASLRVIRSSAHHALQDLREVIGVLRAPSGGEDSGLDYPQPTLTTVSDLVADAREAGMSVDFDEQVADRDATPVSVGRTAYRITQEALTNARKHASGEHVRLRVYGGPEDGLTVDIRNSIPSDQTTPAVPGAGTGLIGLAERATLAGGRLRHGPTGSEFRLEAWLPWPT